jgi:hypothetical protein
MRLFSIVCLDSFYNKIYGCTIKGLGIGVACMWIGFVYGLIFCPFSGAKYFLIEVLGQTILFV